MIRFVGKRWWISGLLCYGLAIGLEAQTQAGERYEVAYDLYQAGRLDLVIDTLAPFLSDPRNLRRSDMLSLVAAAHKFRDEDALARATLLRLFNHNPFYWLDPSVPDVYYLQQDLVIYPKYTARGKGGIYLRNRPRFRNAGSASLSESPAAEAGDPLGILTEFTLSRALYPEGPHLQFGLGLSRYVFRYAAVYENVVAPTGASAQARFSFREKQGWLHLPVYLQHHFLRPGSDFRSQIFIPYGFIGGSLDMLQANATKWTDIQLAYDQQPDTQPVNYPDLTIADLRRSLNYSLTLGGGIQARSGYHLGFIELGFSQMLRNLRADDARAQTLLRELERDFHYQGADFLLSNWQLSIGYTRFFFRASER